MNIQLRYKSGTALAVNRKHFTDAGADVYIQERYVIYPGETKAFPLGFYVDIPNGYAGFIYSRSSMARQGIICQLCPIDAGYTGEVFAIVTNQSNQPATLEPDVAVGQLVIQPIDIPYFIYAADAEARGDGAFGSTDGKQGVQ